jgi:hypothetical protein
MPASDREVWDFLRKDQASSSELNFITYAIYSFEKYDWISQHEVAAGAPPSQQDIDRWTAQITPYRFSVMREKAAALFDDAARRYLADEIERQRQDAVDSSILAAVRSASAFWKQAALALLTATLAPIILGGMILGARYYDLFYPTASAVSRAAPPGPDGTVAPK